MDCRFEREEYFDKIYQKYEPVVYKVAMMVLNDPHAASDVLQDTFWHFHDRMEDICDEAVKMYLVSTARHLALNYVRHEKYEVQTEEIEVEAVKAEIPTESAEETFLCKEQRKLDIELGAEIFSELRKKNEVWYRIMYMFCAEDMSYDEIAEELDIPKDILYCRAYRARRWMYKKYGYKLEEVKAYI